DGVSPTVPAFSAATATASGFNPASEQLVVDADRTKTNLQILIQGETKAEGTGYWPTKTGGETGLPQTFLAGQAIPITVRTVDDYWNLVESPNAGQATVKITATDPNVVNPLVPSAPTSNGVYSDSVNIILRTKNLTTGWLVTA